MIKSLFILVLVSLATGSYCTDLWSSAVEKYNSTIPSIPGTITSIEKVTLESGELVESSYYRYRVDSDLYMNLVSGKVNDKK